MIDANDNNTTPTKKNKKKKQVYSYVPFKENDLI